MPGRFFRLSDDVYVPHRWHLGMPRDRQGEKVHDWDFKRGAAVNIEGRLRIPVEIKGSSLDYSEAGVRIPVVHVKVATVFAQFAPNEVQWVSVDVEGYPDQYMILVATKLIQCVDEKASRIRFWTEEDGRPDMIGQYASVRDMRVDKTKVEGVNVFRPRGWEVALVVSEEIKSALERAGATGTKFTEV